MAEPVEMDVQDRPGRFVRHLGNRFITGVIVTVPLIVTLLVLNIGYRFIDGISKPLWIVLGWEDIPGLGFVTTLFLLMMVGYLATNVLGKKLIDGIEGFIGRIPLIAPVYSAVKQALESFKGMKGSQQFKRVVYVEYPSPGCLLIGFVTGQFLEPRSNDDLTMVFLPTSPNPLTGFVVAVPTSKIIDSELTLEQASKIIMSAGLVVPSGVRLPSGQSPTPVSASGI